VFGIICKNKASNYDNEVIKSPWVLPVAHWWNQYVPQWCYAGYR